MKNTKKTTTIKVAIQPNKKAEFVNGLHENPLFPPRYIRTIHTKEHKDYNGAEYAIMIIRVRSLKYWDEVVAAANQTFDIFYS